MDDNAVRGGPVLTLGSGLALVALALTEGFREAVAVGVLLGVATRHAGLRRR